MYFKKWLIKSCERFVKAFARNKPLATPAFPRYELKSSGELFAFMLGAAHGVSFLRGRGITAAEANELINLQEYYGDAGLILEGLDDFDAVKATVERSGATVYPPVRQVFVSQAVQEHHNHMITCPGCAYCIRIVQKISLPVRPLRIRTIDCGNFDSGTEASAA